MKLESAEFSEAFVNMQAELPTVPKSRKGQEGNQHYKYADLASIMEAAGPILTKHGFAIMQKAMVETRESGEVLAGVETFLIHKSGICQQSTTLLPVRKEHGTLTKAIGGVITYARRYSLSILGICTEDDTEDAPGVGGGRGTREPKAKKSTPQKGREAYLDKPSIAKLKFAAKERLVELGMEPEESAVNDVCRAALKAHGYASSLAAKQSEFDSIFVDVQGWNPEVVAA